MFYKKVLANIISEAFFRYNIYDVYFRTKYYLRVCPSLGAHGTRFGDVSTDGHH